MTDRWDPDFAMRLPLFAPLRAAVPHRPLAGFPGCAELNALAAAAGVPPRNAAGMPIRFVPQAPRRLAFEDRYEPRIFLRGEVQVRADNWHDLFNALVWLTFPLAKSAINRRHYEALCAQHAAGAPNRGPQQDALTLFDEGGVVVAAADPELAALLRNHAWKQLFWQQRAKTGAAMGFFLFGHALYEKALQPYAGVTGRGVILGCTAEFFARPLAAQLAELDGRLAGLLADAGCLAATGDLASVPILGVPGWWPENETESYYDDTAYFRPLPLRPRDRR
jgi:Protein of unknown function (DUF3025)